MARNSYHSDINPMGTDGFEFVEFASSTPDALSALFERMGFSRIAKHRSKRVFLFRQNEINFILNCEPSSHADTFFHAHGPSANAMAFRVKDVSKALSHAKAQGATIFETGKVGPMELNIPAIEGVGGSLIYLVDRYGSRGSIYDIDFEYLPGVDRNPKGAGLTYIDHLTHNVYKGRLDEQAQFYERLFNFREIRYFDIQGNLTGLKSRAMKSPCGKIYIPINESSDDKSQIQEYLEQYKGEGIQHIALGTPDIYASVEDLRGRGVEFLSVPDTYYEKVEERLPGNGEDLARMKKNRILIDGSANVDAKGCKLLLQIFTKTVIGPIFFEVIQRKGDEGFGHGNFKALFVSMEDDQIKRGVLKGKTS